MFWSRKKHREILPWYRDPDYKGTLTEVQKREFDALRSLPKHPAARYEDLPDEVQAYIARLEVDAYDLKQERAVAPALAFSAVGMALVYFHYFDPPALTAFWTWAWGLGLVIVPWFGYRRQWKKNAEHFMPDYLSGGGDSPANEALRKEWELSHVGRNAYGSRERRESISDRDAEIQ